MFLERPRLASSGPRRQRGAAASDGTTTPTSRRTLPISPIDRGVKWPVSGLVYRLVCIGVSLRSPCRVAWPPARAAYAFGGGLDQVGTSMGTCDCGKTNITLKQCSDFNL